MQAEDDLFAAFDRAKEQRDSKYESHIPDGIIDDHQKRLLTAYAQYLERPQQRKYRFYPDEVRRHGRCTVSCDRVSFGDFAFCTLSGNLHICDIRHCDERRDVSGEDVCLFTSKRYGTHFDLDLQDRSGTRDQFSKTPVAPRTEKKVFGPKPKRIKSKTGTIGRKLAPRTIERQTDQSMLYAEARNTLVSILKNSKEPIPLMLAERFATTCVRLWVRIHVAAERMARAIKYRFKYHCVVVAYYMIDGFGLAGTPLLCANEFLAIHLPNMKRFADYGIETAWHTKTTKQFLWALHSLTESDIATLGMSLRQLWV